VPFELGQALVAGLQSCWPVLPRLPRLLAAGRHQLLHPRRWRGGWNRAGRFATGAAAFGGSAATVFAGTGVGGTAPWAVGVSGVANSKGSAWLQFYPAPSPPSQVCAVGPLPRSAQGGALWEPLKLLA
jgi:hypothetical protein